VAQVITPGPRTKDGAPTVLQVVPNLVTGGVERGAVDMAAALTRTGGTAIIASEGGPLEYELKRIGAIHVRLPMASKNPIVMARNIARLKKLILSENVDIVHARSRAPAWSAYYAAKATGRHFITTFHAPYNFSNGLKRRYNAIMTRGERVIAISEFIAGHIEQYYKVEPTRVRVVQRGVDLRHFDPDQVSAERVIKLATDWRLPDGVPLVLLPGRLTRWTSAVCWSARIRAAPAIVRNSNARSWPTALPARPSSSTTAPTWQQPICCRTSWSPPRPTRKVSDAWSARARPWAARWSPATMAARANS
jgi:glycosyltransferase involved in cell wall biosynthesis